MTTLLSLPLIACAGGRTDPVVTVLPELTRPPCRPPASLMCPMPPPGATDEERAAAKAECEDRWRLPAIKPGDRMVDVSARDTAAFNALRRAMIDLQRYVIRECA